LEEVVVVHAGHKDLVIVDHNIALVFGNPSRVFSQQLRPHPIHLSTIITLVTYQVILNY